MIAADKARRRIGYNPDTGDFEWLSGRRAGQKAGCVNHHGYVRIRIEGMGYQAHRLAWLITHDSWPLGEIDHINGVKSDNRLCNLRDVPRCVNQQNQRRGQRGKKAPASLGVSWHKRREKWEARIMVRGQRVHLGVYKTEMDAQAAYAQAKRDLHPLAAR